MVIFFYSASTQVIMQLLCNLFMYMHRSNTWNNCTGNTCKT